MGVIRKMNLDDGFQSNTPKAAFKPAGVVLGVSMSIETGLSIQYNLMDKMPTVSQIRKDNYQNWLYDGAYSGGQDCRRLLDMMETTDLSGNPNRYTGFRCTTSQVVGNSEYFWPEVIEENNALYFRECGKPCYTEKDLGVTSVDILVPVDFVVVRFNKLVRMGTIKFKGVELFSASIGTRYWSESKIPTLFLQFSDDACTSIEVCDVFNDLSKLNFSIKTVIPVSYNRSKSSIR